MARFVLRPGQRVVLRALGDALFAHEGGPRPAQLDALVEGFEAHLTPVSRTLRFGLLAMLVLIHWLPLLLFTSLRSFEHLPREERVRLLERMDRSRVLLLLMPLVAFKSLLAMIFFEQPAELRAMGYPGDDKEAMAAARSLTVCRGRQHGTGSSLDADVVVVGSGAGGAVVARELARAGRSVIVLEEGDWVRPDEYGQLTPIGTLRRRWREAGLSAAVALGDTPFISVLQGKCVGGSSVLTGGVCFRIPDEVLHDWSHDLGLRDDDARGRRRALPRRRARSCTSRRCPTRCARAARSSSSRARPGWASR